MTESDVALTLKLVKGLKELGALKVQFRDFSVELSPFSDSDDLEDESSDFRNVMYHSS